MAQTQRIDMTADDLSVRIRSELAERQGYEPGGQVGQMHADLAARLGGGFADAAALPHPQERVVRFLSVAGGYGALAAAYLGVAFLFFR